MEVDKSEAASLVPPVPTAHQHSSSVFFFQYTLVFVNIFLTGLLFICGSYSGSQIEVWLRNISNRIHGMEQKKGEMKKEQKWLELRCCILELEIIEDKIALYRYMLPLFRPIPIPPESREMCKQESKGLVAKMTHRRMERISLEERASEVQKEIQVITEKIASTLRQFKGLADTRPDLKIEHSSNVAVQEEDHPDLIKFRGQIKDYTPILMDLRSRFDAASASNR